MANPSTSHSRVLSLLSATRARYARSFIALLALPVFAATAHAQTGYYHLDASRPIRVEDASVVERYTLEIEAPSIRAERTTDGVYRYRAEPHISYGILPRTQIEVGAPMEYRDRPGDRQGGLVGISIAGMHSFNNESRFVPALALWAGARLPVGALSPNGTRVGVKGIATRSLSFGRVHFNAEYSTALKTSTCTPTIDAPCAAPPPDQFQDTGNCFKLSPADFSCAAASHVAGAGAPVLRVFGGSGTAVAAPDASIARGAAAAAVGPAPRGRWAGGVAVDHAFPFRSVLLAVGAFVEHDARSGAPMEWTGEAGGRWQLSPRTVFDGGVGRHFTGSDQSWFLTAGLSFELGVPAWMRGS
jgi:hypothetical protein